MRRNPDVEVAPCTVRGRVTGESRPARARELHGAESDAVAHALAHKHPILHRYLVPWIHRAKRLQTVHLELTPR
jgi:PPOX class probable F420-dependent enzyme